MRTRGARFGGNTGRGAPHQPTSRYRYGRPRPRQLSAAARRRKQSVARISPEARMGTHDGGKSSDGGGGSAAGAALGRGLGMRERQLSSLFETTQAGLAVLDGSLRYVHVNDTLAGFSGRTPEEFIGKTVRDVAP